jgi:nucleotide-binding universal stress UspA family protein
MFRDILLPIDLSEKSSWRQSLPLAIEYAEQFDSKLHFISVMPDFRMPMVSQYFPKNFEDKTRADIHNRLDAFVRKRVPEGVEVGHVVVAVGCAYEKILEAAKDMKADLIMMASHRPKNRDFLLGSNADRVVRHFKGSVLVVR